MNPEKIADIKMGCIEAAKHVSKTIDELEANAKRLMALVGVIPPTP